MHFQPTLVRNNLFPFMKPFSYTNLIPKANPSILPKLCQALKLSLQRFTIAELQRLSKKEKTLPPQKPQKIEPQVIELLSSDQEVSSLDSKIDDDLNHNKAKNKLEILEMQEKTDLSKDHIQFQKSSDKEVQQNSNIERKTCLIRKQKLGKTCLKLKKHKYSHIEQNIDLTETANITNSSFSAQQLNRKREILLMRKVCNWNEASQQKKERRQIRMLKN